MQQLRQAIDAGSAEGCARELLDAVPPVIWFIRRNMRAFRKGISLPQFRALVLVEQQPCASVSAVAEHLGASMPTASRIVTGLVDKGLLARAGCPSDRRQLSLEITSQGKDVLRTAWSGTQARVAEKIAGLTPADRVAVAGAMQLLKNTFGRVGLCDALACAADVRVRGGKQAAAEGEKQRRFVKKNRGRDVGPTAGESDADLAEAPPVRGLLAEGV